MNEIWKDIDGFVGKYMVSNLGNVKSLNFAHTKQSKNLKQTVNHYGYLQVSLKSTSKEKTIYVHTLVATAFLPNQENKPEVNHIDGNKLNNNVNNLEWCTPLENTHHAIRTGLRNSSTRKYLRGKDNALSKPVLQYNLQGDFVRKWDCISDAARYYSCSPSSIINCCRGRIKSLKSYLWRTYTNENYPQTIAIPKNRKSPKKIYQYDLKNNLIKIWDGYAEIDNSGVFKSKNVSACCNGSSKTSHGYRWESVVT